MPLAARRWKKLLPVVLLPLAILVYALTPDLILSTRLLLGLRHLSAGEEGGTAASSRKLFSRAFHGRTVDGVLYAPRTASPKRGLVLVPGISELGCSHPQLVSLCRLLATNGFAVLTPDIESLRDFRIEPEAADQIVFWFTQFRSLPGTDRLTHIGVAGISFSGTLALIAAARPEIADSVAFVLGIGAYHDLADCADLWFAPGPVTVAEGSYPTKYYARWIIMLGALDLLPEPRDREYLDQALRSLLLQKEPPEAPAGMGREAARWLRLACAREDFSDPQLARDIISDVSARIVGRLSPDTAAASLKCPVFLAHGAYDDLIPPGESLALAAEIARSQVLISPFLTHTHPATQLMTTWERVKAVFEAFRFLHALVRTSG
jgi:dienelactone hydrolase